MLGPNYYYCIILTTLENFLLKTFDYLELDHISFLKNSFLDDDMTLYMLVKDVYIKAITLMT